MNDLKNQMHLLLKQVQDIAPSFVPENELQVCFLMFEHEMGMHWYHALEARSAEDERWMGMCCLYAGDRERALEHALRALEMGNSAARIDLMRLHLLIGKPEEMKAEMQKVQVECLDRLNQAIWYRNLALVHALHNNTPLALTEIEKGWRVIQTAPEFNLYAPEFLVAYMAILCSAGRNEQAFYYQRRSEEICKTRQQWQLKISGVVLALEHTRLDGVIETAREVLKHSNHKKSRVIAHMSIGRAHLCAGKVDEARPCFEEALKLAQDFVMHDYIFINQEYLFMVYRHLGLQHQAWVMFRRMHQHTGAELYECSLKLHQACTQPELTFQQAATLMDEALTFAQEYGDELEVMRCLMYRCKMLLKYSPEHFEAAVDDLAQYITSQDCGHKNYEDWVFLPEVQQQLTARYPGILPVLTQNRVEVLTLGEERVLLNGSDIKLPLSKAMEVLVFILLHEKVSVQKIISHVFQDMEPQKARNYFHQIKHQLSENLDLFQIAYDKESRLYSIQSNHRILLDVVPLLQDQKTTSQVFLPSSGSDWVLELNARLHG